MGRREELWKIVDNGGQVGGAGIAQGQWRVGRGTVEESYQWIWGSTQTTEGGWERPGQLETMAGGPEETQ